MFQRDQYICELSQQDQQDLREVFLEDRQHQLCLGFEIVDGIFSHYNKLRSFRFPLYFMKVKVIESGQRLVITPMTEGQIYLNHVALAQLVLEYSGEIQPKEHLARFFRHLQSQKITSKLGYDKISLVRQLPVLPEVFDQVRTIIFGERKQATDLGLLDGLKIKGFEIDLESVVLGKYHPNLSPLAAAIENDLDLMATIAQQNPNKFYDSLLGHFLSPGVALTPAKAAPSSLYFPDPPSSVANQLQQQLEQHNIVLLEGPPGTGKSHTIRNLVIQAVCQRQRVLVVSDKEAAIRALEEKLTDYVIEDQPLESLQDRMALLGSGIKWLSQLPASTEDQLAALSQSLQKQLLGQHRPFLTTMADPAEMEERLEAIGEELATATLQCRQLMDSHATLEDHGKGMRPSVREDFKETLDALMVFRQFCVNARGQDILGMIMADYRSMQKTLSGPAYRYFRPGKEKGRVAAMKSLITELKQILVQKPHHLLAYQAEVQLKVPEALRDDLLALWRRHYGQQKTKSRQWLRQFHRWLPFRLKSDLQLFIERLENTCLLLELADRLQPEVWDQIVAIYESFHPDQRHAPRPLARELAEYLIQSRPETTIAALLAQIEQLEQERSHCIRQLFLERLGELSRRDHEDPQRSGTSARTRVEAILKALQQKGADPEHVTKSLVDFRSAMAEAFDVVVCRKEAVSFLFPCLAGSFDLVIVDEATQCRVDDAIPLLFRGKKLLVVGDDRQTLRSKDSALDTYLFEEFELHEYLKFHQAVGIRGGGSNLFSLVKTIKQGSVLLDEHYRCPPDIIAFSNTYSYDNKLKTMQWLPDGGAPHVVVDFSEHKFQDDLSPPTSGKYKGIYTTMIDRFFSYMTKQIRRLEKELGRKIDVEREVAICYFLLKNEAYVKHCKPDFLRKLQRGNDVLDGAGAALQGKERDFIFYLWDVTRSNIAAFRAGDDATRRKGELNVLMSRPKAIAFHYLHGKFDTLDHGKSHITEFLWNHYQRGLDLSQRQRRWQKQATPRNDKTAGPSYDHRLPHKGQLMLRLLYECFAEDDHITAQLDACHRQFDVVIGNPNRRVPLILSTENQRHFAFIDCRQFYIEVDTVGRELVEYYFLLRRSRPRVIPLFCFVHELASKTSSVNQTLRSHLGRRQGAA